MSNIIGTVIPIKDFIGKHQVSVKVNGTMDLAENEVFNLVAEREYVIPYFQREIKWEKENLLELMGDISNGSKFLGNVILTKKNHLTYEIIDGQQRTTMLMMIVQYIRKKYGTRFTVEKTCEFNVNSFSGFKKLLENGFDEDTNINLSKILMTDDYYQFEKYKELWNVISESDTLKNAHKAGLFLNNLRESEINIIINTGDYNEAIGYFLDVNLKGVKLDKEDIFKAYLFSKDNSNETRKLWGDMKKGAENLKKNKITYPMMKIIEHYFYCDLFVNDQYKEILISEEFLLKNPITVEGVEFYTGQHIVTVVNNMTYMKQMLERINKYQDFMYNIVRNGFCNETLEEFFAKSNSSIDIDERKLIYNIINYIVRDSNIIPKILVLRYFNEISFAQKVDKEKIRRIYAIYVLAVFFNIFENRKKSDAIYRIVRSDNWYEKTVEYVMSYFDATKIGVRKATAQYKYVVQEQGNETQEFKCRSLAAIYNYMVISTNKISVRNGKLKELLEFLSDKNMYSLEHFILNNSGKYVYLLGDAKQSSKYIKEVKKYTNSLFNFIFINRELNASLNDSYLIEKLKVIDEQKDKIKCEYSRMVTKCIESSFEFPHLDNLKTKEDVENVVENYLYRNFRDDYLTYANMVLSEVIKKCTQ